MNFLDILGMSVSSLWRRKIRTILTVLGVIIGTASVVVMLSLGLGLKTAMMEEASSYGSLTEIEVSTGYFGGTSTDIQYLNDSTIKSIEELENVNYVSPQLAVYGRFIQGKWESWISIYGVSQEELANINIGEGTIPSENAGTLELVVGNMVIQQFYNSSTYEYPYWDKGELPDVDLMGKTVFTQFDSEWIDDGAGNYTEIPSKKNIFPIVGMVAGDENTYSKYSYSVYTDIDSLKAYLKKTYKGRAIPNQPTDKNGKPFKELVYDRVIVSVDDADNVDSVMTAIQDMGFQAYSNQEWLAQIESQFKIIQAVLGGIGAISLLVAAIGITNTMTMSTYERTKEIGVMKVIGCSLGNIRALFLSEAAFIGFLGGIAGILLSYLLSILVNVFAAPLVNMGEGVKISVIPAWLVLLAIIFATLIGTVSGFFPAQRATKLSPLAAIRNE